MERLSNYLIGGIVLLAAYTVNMGWRMSNVAKYNEMIRRSEPIIRNSRSLGHDDLADKLEDQTNKCKELIAGEKRKAFFVIDWANLSFN